MSPTISLIDDVAVRVDAAIQDRYSQLTANAQDAFIKTSDLITQQLNALAIAQSTDDIAEITIIPSIFKYIHR